jgi:hypothetical protein
LQANFRFFPFKINDAQHKARLMLSVAPSYFGNGIGYGMLIALSA